MTRDEFQQLIADGIVMLDGATGTNLQQAGLPVGVCPEAWILENRTAMIDLQRERRFFMRRPLPGIGSSWANTAWPTDWRK